MPLVNKGLNYATTEVLIRDLASRMVSRQTFYIRPSELNVTTRLFQSKWFKVGGGLVGAIAITVCVEAILFFV